MSTWSVCVTCGLRHTTRSDGRCPRCQAEAASDARAELAPPVYEQELSRCQVCGVAAPTQYVRFSQNIGALLMRFTKRVEGQLCEPCISSTFVSLTLTTLFLGWWGLISMIVTPFILIGNVVERLRVRS